MNKKGFTLIELLVVIAIIGILSAVVVTSVSSSRQKAVDAQIKANIQQVELAMEIDRNENNGEYALIATVANIASLPSFKGTLDSTYNVISNTSAREKFCVWAELKSETGFFVASHIGRGIKQTWGTKTLDTCAPG